MSRLSMFFSILCAIVFTKSIKSQDIWGERNDPIYKGFDVIQRAPFHPNKSGLYLLSITTKNEPKRPVNPCIPSPCGPNSECKIIGESPACSCLHSFNGAPPNCHLECTIHSECPASRACINLQCVDPCSSCGFNTQCTVINHTPSCTCNPQYTGNPYQGCSPVQDERKKLLIFATSMAKTQNNTDEEMSTGTIVILAILIVICVILIGLLLNIQYRRLKMNEEHGILNQRFTNPNGVMEAQTYDKRYEFATDHLARGNKTISGSFGCVEEAIAYGILPHEKETKVVIKSVDDKADPEIFRGLVLELKTLIHVGRHLNVIALLGAVTKNVMNRELVLILEHCRFGNLRNFLLQHRHFFVDQINAANDEFDFSIIEQQPDQSECNELSKSLSMTSLSTAIIIDDTNSASSFRTVSTIDLLCWCYQIARGLEFLNSRNVIHGHISARNILLSDVNVVKIANFCLAQNISKSSKNQSKLPFKSMAPESYKTLQFNGATEVWSYGVLLWELFSLCEEPYQEIDVCGALFSHLNKGYRLEKPKHATKRIYEGMLSCWNQEPTIRPKFDHLAQIFSQIIGAERTKYFDDLNVWQMNSNL